MSSTARPRSEGLQPEQSEAKSFPTTCPDVENVFVGSMVSEKPVMPPRAIGLTPMLPVTTDWGTVEIPDFARITKLPEVPKSTDAVLVGFTLPLSNDRSCEADRKSTRLNSSHLGISYAVFCLE